MHHFGQFVAIRAIMILKYLSYIKNLKKKQLIQEGLSLNLDIKKTTKKGKVLQLITNIVLTQDKTADQIRKNLAQDQEKMGRVLGITNKRKLQSTAQYLNNAIKLDLCFYQPMIKKLLVKPMPQGNETTKQTYPEDKKKDLEPPKLPIYCQYFNIANEHQFKRNQQDYHTFGANLCEKINHLNEYEIEFKLRQINKKKMNNKSRNQQNFFHQQKQSQANIRKHLYNSYILMKQQQLGFSYNNPIFLQTLFMTQNITSQKFLQFYQASRFWREMFVQAIYRCKNSLVKVFNSLLNQIEFRLNFRVISSLLLIFRLLRSSLSAIHIQQTHKRIRTLLNFVIRQCQPRLSTLDNLWVLEVLWELTLLQKIPQIQNTSQQSTQQQSPAEQSSNQTNIVNQYFQQTEQPQPNDSLNIQQEILQMQTLSQNQKTQQQKSNPKNIQQQASKSNNFETQVPNLQMGVEKQSFQNSSQQKKKGQDSSYKDIWRWQSEMEPCGSQLLEIGEKNLRILQNQSEKQTALYLYFKVANNLPASRKFPEKIYKIAKIAAAVFFNHPNQNTADNLLVQQLLIFLVKFDVPVQTEVLSSISQMQQKLKSICDLKAYLAKHYPIH